MGAEYTFYDYNDAEESENNIIKDWLDDGGSAANANFTVRIEQLEASPPGDFADSVWRPPFVKPLQGKWKGFTEIRVKVNKSQYRLIGKKIDRDIFLVTWGYHDGRGWHTDVTPATAKERVNRMISNPAAYRREHEI